MKISIKPINISCVDELLEFETVNRKFFEKTCPPRGERYYDFNVFKSILEELIIEQDKGLVHMYLIYDKHNKIVGRVNLVDIERDDYTKAELGYRIGEEHQGKGYATEAVKLILDEAINIHSINKVVAGTSSKNTASQNVLIKNGFKLIGTQENYILLNGEYHDNVMFEKILNK